MNENKIIIDGIDVSECPAMSTFNMFGQEDKPCCYKYFNYCSNNQNCYFKKLKFKEREINQLQDELHSCEEKLEECKTHYYKLVDEYIRLKENESIGYVLTIKGK